MMDEMVTVGKDDLMDGLVVVNSIDALVDDLDVEGWLVGWLVGWLLCCCVGRFVKNQMVASNELIRD